MPRDSSGVYTLPIAPFVPLTLAKSADMNTALSDIADALTDSQSRAAPTPAQGDLNMNGHNILNLGEVVGDAVASGGVYANGVGSQFGFAFEGPNYLWHWGAANYFDWFNPANGTRSWRAAGVDIMNLDASGNLYATGGLSTGGNAGVVGTVTASGITSTGNASVAVDLGVSRNAYITGDLSTHNATVTGTLGVTGNTSLGGTLGVTGNAGVNGSLTVSNAATVNGRLNLPAILGFANNAAAVAGGLVHGDVYFDLTVGALSIVF
jgi:hypothetical protein